jgi:thiol-disulfide isomerase/thioredoxin
MILLLFNGCSKKEEQDNNITTKENILKTKERYIDKNQTISFLLTDMRDRELNITTIDGRVLTPQIRQPLVLFNLFSSWCKPCMGQMPYLNELQKMYQNDLFVVGVLIPTKEDKDRVAKTLKESLIEYFVSYSSDNSLFINYITRVLELPKKFSIPLSVLYKNGRLYRYYEGAVPMEMLEIEIINAKKLL